MRYNLLFVQAEDGIRDLVRSRGLGDVYKRQVIPAPDEKNVVITFTINEDNKIHVVDVKGGYAFLNHYIKSSLEGKVIKTENALPGINYVMAVKLPTSV